MYAAFPIAIFFAGAAILIGLPLVSTLQTYFKNRGKRSVTCPDDQKSAEIEVDNSFALQSAMHGREHMRVRTCSHWPENVDCGEECLVQVEATPENIERLFLRWFDEKQCSICQRALTRADWRMGRMGFLDDNFKLVELRQIDLEDLGQVAEPKHPLCWKCHQEEKQRQAKPVSVVNADAVASRPI
jgi:hypothetical protein